MLYRVWFVLYWGWGCAVSELECVVSGFGCAVMGQDCIV